MTQDAMRRAVVLFQAGRLDEAEAACAQIQREKGGRHFYAWHLLSVIAAHRGQHERSAEMATRALQLDPRHVEALCNRGAALRALCRFAEALSDYSRALELAPRSADALNGRGVALAALNRHAEAIDCYDRALLIEPTFPQARFNRSMSRLMTRDFIGGWEDYEARWEGSDRPSPRRPFAVPRLEAWDPAARVALWTEQGIGDQLLFSSLACELAGVGQPFVLEVDPRLMPAFVRTHPDWQLVAAPAAPAAFTGCDLHLPIGSLPRLLRPDLESFARQPATLLAADPVRAAAYRSRLAEGEALLVGISWRSFQPRKRRYYELRKSAPLMTWRELSTRRGVRLVDLQYGDTAEERAAFAAAGGRLGRLDELDLFNDLDGVLAAIAACDLVVTTSNVTAHLAGALGKRTLLIYLGANPTFHYWVPDERGRSPWYPTVEIVTDAGLEDWPALMERVARRMRDTGVE